MVEMWAGVLLSHGPPYRSTARAYRDQTAEKEEECPFETIPGNINLVKRLLLALFLLPVACTGSGERASLPEPSVQYETTTSTSVSPDVMNILFLGNSHTSTHDVPGMVKDLLASGTEGPVNVEMARIGFLRTAANHKNITDMVASRNWDVVVLQGQEISQSYTINYSQTEAVQLAQMAIRSGARALFLAEWPREGYAETAYIEGIYDEIAEKSGAEVVPVGRSWDRFLTEQPGFPLWGADGNHSAPEGAFLAAATIAFYIAGPDAEFTVPAGGVTLMESARLTVEEYFGSPGD